MQSRAEMYQSRQAELKELKRRRATAFLGAVGLRAGGYYSIVYSCIGLYNQNPTVGMAVMAFGAVLVGGVGAAQRKTDVLGQEVRHTRSELAQMRHVGAVVDEEAAIRTISDPIELQHTDHGADISPTPLAGQQVDSPKVPDSMSVAPAVNQA